MKILKSNNVGNADSFLFDVIGKWLDLTEPSLEEFAKALAKYIVLMQESFHTWEHQSCPIQKKKSSKE